MANSIIRVAYNPDQDDNQILYYTVDLLIISCYRVSYGQGLNHPPEYSLLSTRQKVWGIKKQQYKLTEKFYFFTFFRLFSGH